MLARRNLPHRAVDTATGEFPVGDEKFDEAICIEVLEHVAEPTASCKRSHAPAGGAHFSRANMECSVL
jgi:2-polyprenyl-3-methyl-5-hydroxy-6-metoxy-1,4-benzoquinol methylase